MLRDLIAIRLFVTSLSLVWIVLTVAVPHTASAVDHPTRKASVYCVISEESAFPFFAGSDRCFKEINGKKSVYKSATVCALNTMEGPRLRFIYSVAPKATCIEGTAISGKDDHR